MVRDPKSEVDMGIQCLIIIYILITHILYFEYINNYEREEDIEKVDIMLQKIVIFMTQN